MNPSKFKHSLKVTDKQMGCQLGNTMSVNVIERIFRKVLKATKLIKAELPDGWQMGLRTNPSKSIPICGARRLLKKVGQW